MSSAWSRFARSATVAIPEASNARASVLTVRVHMGQRGVSNATSTPSRRSSAPSRGPVSRTNVESSNVVPMNEACRGANDHRRIETIVQQSDDLESKACLWFLGRDGGRRGIKVYQTNQVVGISEIEVLRVVWRAGRRKRCWQENYWSVTSFEPSELIRVAAIWALRKLLQDSPPQRHAISRNIVATPIRPATL